LRDAVLSQSDGDAIVLNLGQVDAIDAYGIGMLLRLQESARSRGTVFKLMNTVHQVHRVLLVTGLDRAFEFCSVPELLCLMHRASERPTQAAVA
jgi:anti-anti-sigma factor